MATRSRPRTAESHSWRDDLTQIVSAAVSPLTDEIKEMRSDINKLQLNSVARQDVYDRAIMDEKLKGLADELTGVKGSIEKFQADLYKILGGVAIVVSTVVLLFQHISIH